MWLHEVINSLYEAGLQNDKLPLLFLENKNAQVAIKSNGNISKRVNIKNIIMQGSVWGSICCVVLMDKLGKLAYSNPDLLYFYKGLVGTPPLQMVDDILAIQKCSSKSLKLNSAINTFIDLEKLTLSKKKCHNIHIGKQKKTCPALAIHGSEMKNSKQETYLGDIIHESGSIKPNIEKRKSKGYGITSNILAIVNEIPLAQWRTEAGLNLRQAMLVNGTLFNSEAWHGVTKKDIILLEKVDESLLRGLLQAHPKIPLEALFLETKSIPIRYILASRRLMYLHNILQRDPNEMVRKIFEAQKTDTSTGDFVELVKEDCEAIELNMGEDDIKKISRDKLKKILKSRVTEAAFKYLISLKQSHSKMENVKYEQFEMSSYLKSPLFKIDDISLLLALKTRTVRGIRNDFGGLYPDKTCPLGCGDLDTLQNILTCSVLQKDDTSTDISTSVIKYEDIFCGDIVKQKQITEKYRQLLDLRNNLLNSLPVATTGPVHST